MSDEPGLFDVEPLRVALPEPEALTNAERRARRYAAAEALGTHPLGVVLRSPIRLHPEAAPLADRDAPGLRCGSCRFRVRLSGGQRDYPKCVVGAPDDKPWRGVRVTGWDGTDVRTYWPACRDYQPTP